MKNYRTEEEIREHEIAMRSLARSNGSANAVKRTRHNGLRILPAQVDMCTRGDEQHGRKKYFV